MTHGLGSTGGPGCRWRCCTLTTAIPPITQSVGQLREENIILNGESAFLYHIANPNGHYYRSEKRNQEEAIRAETQA